MKEHRKVRVGAWIYGSALGGIVEELKVFKDEGLGNYVLISYIRDDFSESKVLDAVSINYYHRWSAEHGRMDNWVKLSGRPFLVSEWYAQSVASASAEATGAGFRVKTDRGRGLFYQNLALGLLRHGGCVGWHWFKYSGDEKGFHKGLVNSQYVPHADMLNVMRDLNRRVYPLAEHFRRTR